MWKDESLWADFPRYFFTHSFLSFQALSLEKGKWSYVKTDEYCYIGSLATSSDLPPEKNRGDFYILVYKNIGSPEIVVQIEAGYDYKVGPEINVKIDQANYIFYTTEDLPSAAWTNDDKKVIFAHNRKPDDPSVNLSRLSVNELPKYVNDNLDTKNLEDADGTFEKLFIDIRDMLTMQGSWCCDNRDDVLNASQALARHISKNMNFYRNG